MKSFKSLFLIIAAFIAVFTGAMSSYAEDAVPVIESIKPDVPVSSGKLEISGKNLLVNANTAQIVIVIKRVVRGQVTGKVTGTVTGKVTGTVTGQVAGAVQGTVTGQLDGQVSAETAALSTGTVIEEIIFKHNEVELWNASKITLTLPKIKKVGIDDDDIEIRLTVNNGEKTNSQEKIFFVLSDSSIATAAILFKDKNMSDEEITNSLYLRGKQDRERDSTKDYTKENVFGNARLSDREFAALKDAHFDGNFIAKMTGERQHINLGVSAVWLNETRRVVAAPMLRIFLIPKSFYEPRADLFKSGTISRNTITTFLRALLQRTDLNVGYTSATSTDATTGNNVDKSYYLVGVSFEINPAALLNGGYAVLSGKADNGVRGQWYVGLTVDENILRSLKILK
ncbi:MAG: hypothetical protein Q8M83_02970 [bacterium]|nr:hypothetical protein [bacterium]